MLETTHRKSNRAKLGSELSRIQGDCMTESLRLPLLAQHPAAQLDAISGLQEQWRLVTQANAPTACRWRSRRRPAVA
jgi:hypothetical protein